MCIIALLCEHVIFQQAIVVEDAIIARHYYGTQWAIKWYILDISLRWLYENATSHVHCVLLLGCCTPTKFVNAILVAYVIIWSSLFLHSEEPKRRSKLLERQTNNQWKVMTFWLIFLHSFTILSFSSFCLFSIGDIGWEGVDFLFIFVCCVCVCVCGSVVVSRILWTARFTLIINK